MIFQTPLTTAQTTINYNKKRFAFVLNQPHKAKWTAQIPTYLLYSTMASISSEYDNWADC